MSDETGVKSSFKDKFFLVCAGRRTLSISGDPDNLMSEAGSPEPRGQSSIILVGVGYSERHRKWQQRITVRVIY